MRETSEQARTNLYNVIISRVPICSEIPRLVQNDPSPCMHEQIGTPLIITLYKLVLVCSEVSR
jgi:hypothetical protein